MTRKTRMVLVLAVAVITASLAAAGVYYAVRTRPAERVEVSSAHVVVAAKPLAVGALLAKADVRRVAWPARYPLAGAFESVDQVINRGLVAALSENEPITENKLAPQEAGAGLPPTIRPGMRAMSVKVNEVVGVAGFILPGAKVDVLVTVQRDSEAISRVVVSNVQVLATGDRYDELEAKKEGKPIRSSVVTLMVTPPDAERIALASTEGQIMLALRNPLDTEATITAGVRSAALLAGTDAPRAAPVARPPASRPAAARAPVPAPQPPRVIETIRAGERAMELLP